MSLISELKRRNVLRVAAAYLVVGWLLTEVLTTLLPTLGAPEWAVRAVILIFALGFIPTVIFSWLYEWTPEGIKHEHEVVRDESALEKPSRKLEYITVASVVILIVFIGLFSARQTGDEETNVTISNASIAVLPFVNMSNDKDNEYFSDGLTETLLHMLAQIPDLKVAARTSSFAFKGQNMGIQEIAAALEVAHILEGSVQRVGDRVRITAQLIRASDGFHVWSSSYDRTLDDIFGIQDEIARKVGNELSVTLLGEQDGEQMAGINTANPDAYDLYLLARKQRATFSYGGLQAAEDLLKGALLIDPDFVDAKRELATSYVHQIETGLLDQSEGYAQVMALSEQVLAVRPEDVVARATMVFSQTALRAMEGDINSVTDAVVQLRGFVAEAPDELQPRLFLVRAYKVLQQWDSALPVLDDALRRDPFNPRILYELGAFYMRLERWDEARASLEKSLEIEPAQPNAYKNLAELSLRAGDGVGYVKYFLKAIEVDPKDHELSGILAGFLYRLQLIDEGDDLRSRVVAVAPTSEIAYHIDLLRAQSTGDEKAGVAAARRVIEDDNEDPRFAYAAAIQYLLRTAARNGTFEQESAYLDRHSPGILDIERESAPGKYRIAQGAALDAWYVTLPRDELLSRLDALLTVAQSIGLDPTQDPKVQVDILAMRGEVETAIEVAVGRVFSQSVAMNLEWRRTFAQAQYAEIVADQRIQAAMQRWQDEEKALRGQVQTYLADLLVAT